MIKVLVPTVITSFVLGYASHSILSSSPIDPNLGQSSTQLEQSKEPHRTKPHAAGTKVNEQYTPKTITPNTTVNSTPPKTKNNAKTAHVLSADDIISLVADSGFTNQVKNELSESIEQMTLKQQQALYDAVFTQLPNNKLNSLLAKVSEEIFAKDPNLALQMIMGAKPHADLTVATAALKAISAKNPKMAWDLSEQLGAAGEGRVLTPSELRKARVDILESQGGNPEKLETLIDIVSQIEGQEKGLYMATLMNKAAQNDLDGTLTRVVAMDSNDTRTRALTGLMKAWSDQNPKEALTWLNENAGLSDDFMVMNTATQLLKQNGESDFNSIYQNADSPENKQRLASAAARHYASQDVDQSIEWLKKVEIDRLKYSTTFSTLREMGYDNNLADHIKLLEGVFSGPNVNPRTTESMFAMSLGEWVKYDRKGVQDYLGNLGSDKQALKNALTQRFQLADGN